MAEKEESPKDGIPQLTMNNWNSSFKNAFLKYAIAQGEAADILTTGNDIARVRPNRGDYGNSAMGSDRYREDKKDYEDLWEGKKKLMSLLLRKMSTEVTTIVEGHQDYQEAFMTYNLHRMWQITQEVVQGRGAASVYTLVVRLLKMKQTGEYTEYSNKFKEAVADLTAQGTPVQVMPMILNALFVIGLNQTQFKEQLDRIYGTVNWPNYNQLSAELYTFTESQRMVKSITFGDQDGKISANVADTEELICWNCGQPGHTAGQCEKKKASCPTCGRNAGHIGRFHEQVMAMKKAFEKNRKEQPRGGVPRGGKSRDDKKKKGKPTPQKRRTDKRKKQLQRAMAYVAEEDSEDEEDIESDEESEEDDDTTASFMVKSSNSEAEDKNSVILDTGCNGAHIFHREAKSTVQDTKPSTRKVHGVGGDVTAESAGKLGKFGRVLIMNNDKQENLLSVMQMIKETGGYFTGDSETLKIHDKDGKLLLTGRNEGDDFWRTDLTEIKRLSCLLTKTPSAMEGETVPVEEETNFTPITEKTVPSIERVTHFTAEEIRRASRARDMCRLLGHPGTEKLATALDHGNYPATELTSDDVRNAQKILGDCIACVEGKMKADPTPKVSTFPPPKEIGEQLNCDIIPLKNTTIGGYRFLLFAAEYKTRYITLSTLSSKATNILCQGFESIISELKSHGHQVKRIIIDHENALLSCKTFLANKGIELIELPKGYHEKFAERCIQTLKQRKRAILASLPYELPHVLEAELYYASAYGCNATPCERSGLFTPYELVKRRKPYIPHHHFGQTGLFHHRRKDNPDQRSEWGIFLNHGDFPRNKRAFIPSRGRIYSVEKFIPQDHIPPEWNYPPRIRRIAQVQPSTPPSTPPTLDDLIEQSQESEEIQREDNSPRNSEQSSRDNELSPPSNTSKPKSVTFDPVLIRGPSRQDDQTRVRNAAQTPDNQDSSNTLDNLDTTPQNERAEVTSSNSNEATVQRPSSLPTDHRPRREAAARTWRDGPAHSRAYQAALKRVLNDPHGPLGALKGRLSVRKALADSIRRKSTLKAIEDEILNMVNMKVGRPTRYRDIPKKYRKNIIPAHMFLKDKYKADGSFDKTKARMVAGGNFQDPDMVGDTYSPTVNPISVFTQLQITCSKQQLLSAYDVKGAFLLASVDRGKHIYVKIPPDVVEHWIRLFPQDIEHVDRSGWLILKLEKYMYGLQESPHQFNALLDQALVELDFKKCRADPCLYTKVTSDGLMIVSAHVDDLLVTSPSRAQQAKFERDLSRRFEIVSQHKDISYLGMSIQYNMEHGTIMVSQPGFVEDILKKNGQHKLTKFAPTPATADLFKIDDMSPPCDRTKYLSLLMSIMYAARFTRPDVLTAATVLATRCANPTESDMIKLLRVLRYLAGTPNYGIIFNTNAELQPVIFADAGHASHPDARGHGGIIITLGSAPVFCRSFKLKHVTRSSSESELIVLEESSTYAVWYKLLLAEIGCAPSGPIPIFQDNKSTILIAQNGGNFKRTKHLLVRESYVSERIQEGDITLKYLATDAIPADMLTKNLPRVKMEQHMHFLCMF